MIKYILGLVLISTCVFAQDINSEIVRINAGVVESEFAREVISNMVTFVAYQEADNWSGYVFETVSNTVDAAEQRVAQYRNEQEGVGYINYYITTWGSGGVIATDTNATVKAVKIDVLEQANGSMIELYYHFEDDIKTELNRIQFTESIGKDADWNDIAILETYETNIVVNGSTKTTMYFKLFSETTSGFFRFSAQLKSIDIGESLHVVEGITIDNVRGLTFTIYAETDDPAVTNKVEVKDGLFMGGTINRARLLQDDTAHELGESASVSKGGLTKGLKSTVLNTTTRETESASKDDVIRSFLDTKYQLEQKND